MNLNAIPPLKPWRWSRIACSGALFFALITGLATYDIVRAYRENVAQSERDLHAGALVIAEQTARSLQTVDLVLRQVAREGRSGALAAMNSAELHDFLAQQAAGLTQIDGIDLMDASGRIVATSGAVTEPQWSARPGHGLLVALRDAPALVVGHASRTAGAGATSPWVFPVARRLQTASGEFAGAVVAPIRVEAFQRFYRDVHPVEGTTIDLLHRDGSLQARDPPADAALGRHSALFDAMRAADGAAGLRFTDPQNGEPRFGALAPVTGYPLVVAVSRDVARALAPWRRQAVATGVSLLGLGSLATLLMALLRRQFVRLDQTRRKLEISRERYALAVAGSDAGIWDWDIAGDRIAASPRAYVIFGLPPGPESRMRDEWHAALQIHPDDDDANQEALRAHLEGDSAAFHSEFRVRHADGVYRWVRLRGKCVRDAAGKALRMAGSVTDIDAQRRAEDGLRQSEERFALAVAGSDDGVWDFDFTAGIAFASQRARRIMGLPPRPDVQPLVDWLAELPIHPDDMPLRNAAVEAHLAGRTPSYKGEWRIVHPDGSSRWVRVRGICVRDDDGRPLRMAGSVSDIDARRRAEEALRESEERYALAVAGSDVGVWDWDYRSGIAFESARARELQGLPLEPEAQPLAELIASLQVHPDDAPRRAEALRAHLAGESPAFECEYRVRHADGDYRWIRVRALCIREDNGSPCRIAGSVTDIDERKRAEQARCQSEERFALAVAGSNDGILDWDIVDDSMYISARALQIIGIDADAGVRPRAEWAAMSFERVHPDDAERVSAVIGGIQNNGRRPHDGEYRVRRDDGGYRWVRFRGMHVRDADGKPIRWAGSVSDIDAAKQVEEALRRSEERYQLAVAGSQEGLWDWDLPSDQLFLSARAQEQLWLEPVDPQQQRRYWIDRTHYHPDDVPVIRAAISAHLRGHTPHFEVEYRLRHHSGSWHWYRQRGLAIRHAAGKPTRMAGSMEDITERKNADVERDHLEGRLRQAQKLEAIGTLAGGIAHDFNNILAAILGYGELAQKDAAAGSALHRHIDAAMSAAMRAKSLVERILAFSRSGMGERVAVHVQSVVAEALDGVAASMPPGIRLEQRLDGGDAALLGDPTQVHQVVMNLCANAIQSMQQTGGTLTVTLDRMGEGDGEGGPLCATCELPAGRYLRLVVRDTGCGIAASVLERIFDPFFTTREIGVGTGLGLSLAHGIVTDLGGGIEVASRVGEGSTFTVYLPWQDTVSASAPAAEAELPAGEGQTILLVDDEDALVRLGEEMIAELGYEPVGFTSGRAALDSLRAEPQRFNAVLSDEAMPEMTGTELAQQIRKLRPDIPIVLMSGYVTPALSARAQEVDAIEVLSKPLRSSDIARSLAAALQSKHEPAH